MSRDAIDAAVVHERNAGGDLVPTEWAELLVPPAWFRFAERADGRIVLEFHVFALAALRSQAKTRDNLGRAMNLCRCPYPVIRPEDVEKNGGPA